MSLPRTLIDPKLIYLEPAVRGYPRGREVLARFPGAELVEVASHWNIPQLADPALAGDGLKAKRDTLVLGVKKGMQMRPNGRSADFIAPSSSNGCAMACAYC
jgi:spore photoproduct lyase